MKLSILLGSVTCVSISIVVNAANASIKEVSSVYKVNKIHDGDTITVVNTQDNSVKKVRLACIDAPEDSQPQGRLSTVTLNAFIPIGSEVKLNQVDTDKYGRIVAEVFKNNVNVNYSMLKQGQAVVYHKYLSNCPNSDLYVAIERLAKKKKIGFWNDPTFIAPKDWRRGIRPLAQQPQAVSQPSNGGRNYIAGSCKYLKSLGLSRFTPGDPNYTSRRDRDNDGIACE